MSLLKVTKVTTKHQKWPKVGANIIICLFLPEGLIKSWPKAQKASAKTRSPHRWRGCYQRGLPRLVCLSPEFQHVLYAQSISALLFGINFHLKI